MREDLIGANLRQLRKAAGLSLSAAAELTGVSKAMLGQIERGESSPTIATLWKITRGFHLPLTALIEGACPDAGRSGTIEFPGSLSVTPVFPFDPALRSETFLVGLEAGQSHDSRAHDQGVIEEILLQRGALELRTGDDWQTLSPGKGVRFRADQPHGYRAGPEGAAFFNTLHYPAPLGLHSN
ncbi:MAG: XRE family transcriptional regulator [Alphaproteobacteria bacterium MedPE-SWcel]|nr:MAG: XRE family transcriptional regulator [Alphaproteobacteria bacterium MedPE-SWcel]